MTNPPGVSLTAATGRYRAQFRRKYIGTYETSIEAEFQIACAEYIYLLDRTQEVKKSRLKLYKAVGLLYNKRELAKED